MTFEVGQKISYKNKTYSVISFDNMSTTPNLKANCAERGVVAWVLAENKGIYAYMFPVSASGSLGSPVRM